jgi:serine/threonine protein kinase
VALKTIRSEIASNPAIIERFKKEVRQAHQVTHPNICRVYDLFSHEFSPGHRMWFLTMQLLKGETLQQRLRRKGPLSRGEALELVRQIISGLSEAHRHGIVHRDFKSGNIILVGDGRQVRALVTDFGLASEATTAGLNARGDAGQGTPAYTAPEQWFEGTATHLSDQYSLGVVMCEMVTGERPTPVRREGQSLAGPQMPASRKLDRHWDSAIRRCLKVQPEDRFRSLDQILERIDPVHRRRVVLRWAAVVIATICLTAMGVLIDRELNRLPSLAGLRRITPPGDFSESPKQSRDGSIIAFASDTAEKGNLDIFVQRLPDGKPQRITKDPATDESPSISPDGHLVAFESSRSPRGIYIADVNAGTERFIAADGHGPGFSPDGRWLLYWTGEEYGIQPTGKIFLYDLWNGTQKQLAGGMADARIPLWNSDGHHILFAGCAEANKCPAGKDWWVTSIDGEAPRGTGATPVLVSQGLRPSIYFGGWQSDTVVFSAVHDSAVGLWEIRLNPLKPKIKGPAKQLIAGDDRDFIISSSLVGSSLAICQWNPAIHIWRVDHAGASTHAKLSRVTDDPEFDLAPNISHNGRWLVFVRGYANSRKIVLIDNKMKTEKSLSINDSSKYAPVIDDSGATIAYEASDGKAQRIWLAHPDGTKRPFCTDCRHPSGWIGEDKALLYTDTKQSEIRMKDDAGEKALLKIEGGSVQDAVWSPETGYVVFTVLKPGLNGQIFTARYSAKDRAIAGNWIEVTPASDFSRKPRWSGDGRTIYYLSKADGYWCVWARHFDPGTRHVGKSFVVQHYHDQRAGPGSINADGLNLSAAGDTLYFNVIETGSTIWIGKLERKGLFSPDK